jgi:hypothetical protein
MMIGIGTPRSQSKIARPNLSSLADANLVEISHTTVRSPDLFQGIQPAVFQAAVQAAPAQTRAPRRALLQLPG